MNRAKAERCVISGRAPWSASQLRTLSADPVLLQTGMFALEQTDLVLPGRIPLVIRRAAATI